MTPGDTYFYNNRPVTIMALKDGLALIRQGNASKKLDIWVSINELH